MSQRNKEAEESQELCSAGSIDERTGVAAELRDLQRKILKIAATRDRLPQPLFWSLFSSRIKDIKKHKELERLLRETLGGGS